MFGGVCVRKQVVSPESPSVSLLTPNIISANSEGISANFTARAHPQSRSDFPTWRPFPDSAKVRLSREHEPHGPHCYTNIEALGPGNVRHPKLWELGWTFEEYARSLGNSIIDGEVNIRVGLVTGYTQVVSAEERLSWSIQGRLLRR